MPNSSSIRPRGPDGKFLDCQGIRGPRGPRGPENDSTVDLSNVSSLDEALGRLTSITGSPGFIEFLDEIVSGIESQPTPVLSALPSIIPEIETVRIKSPGPPTPKPEIPFPEDLEAEDEKEACSVCMSRIKNTVLLPCRHQSTCHTCSKELKKCPICREKIDHLVVAYRS